MPQTSVVKYFITTLSDHEYNASKIQRVSFFERNIEKPKAKIYNAATTNESIQFAINATKGHRHVNAWSQNVIQTSKGDEFVTTCLRDSSIVHQHTKYKEKCELLGKQPMSRKVVSSLIKTMTHKVAKLQACQDSTLCQHLHEQIIDLNLIVSNEPTIFSTNVKMLLLLICVFFFCDLYNNCFLFVHATKHTQHFHYNSFKTHNICIECQAYIKFSKIGGKRDICSIEIPSVARGSGIMAKHKIFIVR